MRRPLALLVATFCLLSATRAADIPPRPNILFLLTDDQRWDAIHALGNVEIKTPTFEGTGFTGPGEPASKRKRRQQ